jgi:hypothetical protein
MRRLWAGVALAVVVLVAFLIASSWSPPRVVWWRPPRLDRKLVPLEPDVIALEPGGEALGPQWRPRFMEGREYHADMVLEVTSPGPLDYLVAWIHLRSATDRCTVYFNEERKPGADVTLPSGRWIRFTLWE